MPPIRTTAKGYDRAHALRRESTHEEKRLWEFLRREEMGVKFRRQHALGTYIVDFCCIKRRLIIELDGNPHLKQREYDEERTAQLELLGYRILRFWNHEIMEDIESVVKTILRALEYAPNHTMIVKDEKISAG